MKITRHMLNRFVSNSLLISTKNAVKRFFISLMAVAGAFNLCSCSNEVIEVPDAEKPIVFDNIQTRGIVGNADEILSMGVFAQMNLGKEGEPDHNSFLMLLENEHVERATAQASWTYANTRYWVTDRVFRFFAVWPYSGDNPSVTNVESIAPAVANDGAYGYSVTFDTPEAADQELLTAQTTVVTKTGEAFPEAVGFKFQHELTNLNLKIWSNGAPENVNDKIKVKEVSIRNVTKSATLNTTISGSSWSYSSDKMVFTKNYGDEGITVSQAQIENGELVSKDNNPGIPFGDGLLLIPHTITSSSPVIVEVIYDLQRPIDQAEDLWEQKKLMVVLPESTWPAGKKLTYNLIISGDRTITEFQLNTVVEDWIPHTEEIDFAQQVEVEEGKEMNWVEGTYESWNRDTGEVVLFTDIDKVAICEFNILAPVGATWTASLIPLTASAMDAFSIVEDSKYGEVGTDRMQSVKIKINNPDPISARNACKLRITVQTPDGRTIVVKNLMPEQAAKKGVEEFTIIQNLING